MATHINCNLGLNIQNKMIILTCFLCSGFCKILNFDFKNWAYSELLQSQSKLEYYIEF